MARQATVHSLDNIALSQEVFEAIASEHVLWLISEGENGKRANFRDRDLRACHISEYDLSGAQLRGAILDGMDLRHALLEEADLTETSMRRSKLDGANLRGAMLHHANAEHASFTKSNLSRANFSAAILAGANLQQAFLESANLRECNAAGADFKAAILDNAALRGGKFQGVKLHAASLRNADCRDVDFSHAVFDETILENTQMRDAVLEGVSFLNADFGAAADIPDKYRSTAFQQERASISASYAAVADEHERLRAREAEFINTRNEIEEQINIINNHERIFLHHIEKQGSMASYYAALWGALTAGVAVILLASSGNLSSPNLGWMEITIIIAAAIGFLTLHFLTAAQPYRIARQVASHMAMRTRTLKEIEGRIKTYESEHKTR